MISCRTFENQLHYIAKAGCALRCQWLAHSVP